MGVPIFPGGNSEPVNDAKAALADGEVRETARALDRGASRFAQPRFNRARSNPKGPPKLWAHPLPIRRPRGPRFWQRLSRAVSVIANRHPVMIKAERVAAPEEMH